MIVSPSPARKALTIALAAALLATGAAAIPGCEFFGWVAQSIDPPIKKVYELKENQPLLVIVDDPNKLLGNPATANLLAVRVGFEIEKNVDDIPIIPQDKLESYRQKKGEAFDKISLATIGKDLGAKQVVSVYVESAELNQDAGVLKPRLLTRVKVIDVDTNSRAFPPLDMPSSDDPMLANRGFAITSQFFNKATTDENRSDFTVAMQTLAKRAGVDIAKIFYDHGTEEPGERFKTAN